MRILIEEHQYPAQKVENIIVGLTNLRNIDGKVSVNHVGYYFNPQLRDTVFILPKVLLEDVNNEELVFRKYKPEDIINLQEQNLLDEKEYTFIYKLSVWIYRAIVVYRDANPQSDVILQQFVQQMSQGRLRECTTYLDILLALQKFNRDNENFFFFILHNLHSGFNKINWTRTISKSEAVLQKNEPIYINPVNKKRQINFDEELIIIFFSILNYMYEYYGFPVHIPVNYELITGARFETYINGLGRARLLQIKHKYFSDKALYLWELCFAFFDCSPNVKVEVNQQEYILVKNFNIVFEAIIDELIGTDRNQLPQGLADQSDGKIVDHLWVDNIILPNDEEKPVYYIGDSKYYKHKSKIGENSIFKQFTYARNVIQWSFDAIMGRTKCDDEKYKIRLRDDRTEGYNVVPNFFISAFVDFGSFDYKDDALILHPEQDFQTTYQFNEQLLNSENKLNEEYKKALGDRLFDRDTLLISHYDVNFLFVLAMYARNDAVSKANWKAKVRNEFRTRIQKLLNQKYAFYAMKGYNKLDSEHYIDTNFQKLLGKIYRVEGEEDIYTLALERTKVSASAGLLGELRQYFYVAECEIDKNQDPNALIEKEIERVGNIERLEAQKVVVVDDNLCEQTAVTIRQQLRYAIGLGTTEGALSLAEGYMNVRYLVLHKLTAPLVFELEEGPKLATKQQLGDIPRKMKESEVFLVFKVRSEQPLVSNLISQFALNNPEGNIGRRESYVTELGSLFRTE